MNDISENINRYEVVRRGWIGWAVVCNGGADPIFKSWSYSACARVALELLHAFLQGSTDRVATLAAFKKFLVSYEKSVKHRDRLIAQLTADIQSFRQEIHDERSESFMANQKVDALAEKLGYEVVADLNGGEATVVSTNQKG